MENEDATYDSGLYIAPQPKRAVVAVLEGATSTTVPIAANVPLAIGRSRSCAIHVNDPTVSRVQATFGWSGGATFWVEDHGSKNGTFVGVTKICGRVELPVGETVRVGPASLVLMLPQEERGVDSEINMPPRAFVAVDPATTAVVEVLARAARKDATVLLLGETGVGKEVMAHWVHTASPRAKGPFIALNCGAVPESLAESTFFGHERGAFTGALQRQLGILELANGGTLFLDEIGELSLSSQTRLLRALDERRVHRVGGANMVELDFRLVAATHRDLARDVAAGRFREDLMYRIDVVRVRVPPLRDRPEDVVPLAQRFLDDLAPGESLRFSAAALRQLERSAWPGNVRQLRNAVHRAYAMVTGQQIEPEHLALETRPTATATATGENQGTLSSTVGASERETIAAALAACNGNQTHAAARLGIARRTLIYKMEKHGLKPQPRTSESS